MISDKSPGDEELSVIWTFKDGSKFHDHRMLPYNQSLWHAGGDAPMLVKSKNLIGSDSLAFIGKRFNPARHETPLVSSVKLHTELGLIDLLSRLLENDI